MNAPKNHKQPALHNAMWPGLVGKGPGAETPIDLDTMLKDAGSLVAPAQNFEGHKYSKENSVAEIVQEHS